MDLGKILGLRVMCINLKMDTRQVVRQDELSTLADLRDGFSWVG